MTPLEETLLIWERLEDRDLAEKIDVIVKLRAEGLLKKEYYRNNCPLCEEHDNTRLPIITCNCAECPLGKYFGIQKQTYLFCGCTPPYEHACDDKGNHRMVHVLRVLVAAERKAARKQ